MPSELSASDRELWPSSRSNNPLIDDEFEYIPYGPELQKIDYEFDKEINMSRKKRQKSNKPKERRPKKKGELSYMTSEDIQELEFLFKDYFKEGKTPNKLTIKEILEKNKESGGLIHRFSVEKIQKRICNMVYPKIPKKMRFRHN